MQEVLAGSAAPMATANRSQPDMHSSEHLLGIPVDSPTSSEHQAQHQTRDFWLFEHQQPDGEQEVLQSVTPLTSLEVQQRRAQRQQRRAQRQQPQAEGQQPQVQGQQPQAQGQQQQQALEGLQAHQAEVAHADQALLTLHCMDSIRRGVDMVQAVAHAMQNRTIMPWHAAADLLQVGSEIAVDLPVHWRALCKEEHARELPSATKQRVGPMGVRITLGLAYHKSFSSLAGLPRSRLR